MNNKIRDVLTLALLIIATVGLAYKAEAQSLASLPRNAEIVQSVGEARPILAWNAFCQNYPAECAVETREEATIPLTPKLWQTVVAVNQSVNGRLRAVTDMAHWGVADRWDLAEDGSGDCEDFQLLKRKLLVEAGLPRRALRMTVVIDEKKEGHAVLMVRTDRGDFILDNKTNAVLPWSETGYIFVKRESQTSIGWVSLGGATSPVATANQ